MKRPLKVASKLVTESQFRRLQEEWDARLKMTDFVDIERGRDLNSMDASTFRGVSDGGHGMEVMLVDPMPGVVASGGEQPSIYHSSSQLDTGEHFADAPQARLWALLSQAANDLPREAKLRSLLVDITTCGEIFPAAERHGVDRKAAARRMRRLCNAVGVDYDQIFASPRPRRPPQPVEAAPVRRLSRVEIRALRYTPPKRMGA